MSKDYHKALGIDKNDSMKQIKDRGVALTLEQLKSKIDKIKIQDIDQNSLKFSFDSAKITDAELQFWNELECDFLNLKNIFIKAQNLNVESSLEYSNSCFEGYRKEMTKIFHEVLQKHEQFRGRINSDFMYGFRSFITYPSFVLSERISIFQFYKTFAEFLFPLYEDLSNKIPLN